jgi:hypothetical protein
MYLQICSFLFPVSGEFAKIAKSDYQLSVRVEQPGFQWTDFHEIF